MASLILKGSSRSALSSVVGSLRIVTSSRIYSSVAADSDVVSAAPDVSLQKAQIWNGGVSSMFSTIPVTDFFKGKKVANFGLRDVPSNKNDIDKFKAKGIDSVVFAAVSNPHVVNARPEKLGAKDAVEFNGDSDGSLRQKDLSQTSNILRPLSPHLPIYKPHLNATFSIYHRISGGFLSAIVLFYYLLYLKMGLICFTYDTFYQFFFYFHSSKLPLISAEITALALSYHLYKGFHHLFTDIPPSIFLGRKRLR